MSYARCDISQKNSVFEGFEQSDLRDIHDIFLGWDMDTGHLERGQQLIRDASFITSRNES